MRPLANTFSWSRSRASTFDRCRREYWWQYYGAWGGWDPEAPPEAREAYVLKNLANRWSWVGTVVHQAIEELLRRLARRARGGELRFDPTLDPAHEVEALTRRMRDHFRESRRGEYRALPKKRFGLVEHEYREPVTDAEWKAANEKACTALAAFLESDVLARIRASDPAAWFPIENRDQFLLEGTGVWAVPDFAMRQGGSGVVIYDWKTGAPASDGSRLQMACYTLYMEAVHGADAAQVENHVVYLGREVVEDVFTLPRSELDAARATMTESMARMRALLRDSRQNVALQEDFPMTEDRAKCGICSFRRLCGR